jgi:probable HAF family extracellular repeat protein
VNDLIDTVAGAAGINNQGLVVGQGSLPSGRDQAFLWSRGSIADLGTFGGPESGSHAINDRGQVVGTADAVDESEHAFLWNKGNILDLQTLGGLGGPTSEANHINAPGVVVGFAATSTPDPTLTTGPFESHAFSWAGGGMQDMGTLGGPNSIAIANNASGLIVGWSQVDSNIGIFGIPDLHAAMWTNGTITPLPGLGGPITLAIDVNNEGVAVGQSFLAGGFPFHAVVWKNGSLSDIDPGPAVDVASLANGINNQGEVVGMALSNNFVPLAAVWQNRVMTDLNTLIPSDSGWYLMTATGVNDMGQIVGNGFLNGSLHAFLLTPSAGGGKAGTSGASQSISVSNTTLQWVILGKSGLLKGDLGR